MADGLVRFEDVEVLHAGLLLKCRIGHHVVDVPPLCMLPGSELMLTGDIGVLILARDVARTLGLFLGL